MPLKKIGKKIPLNSTGKSKGTSYTNTEKATAKAILLGVLIASGHLADENGEIEKEIPADVVKAIEEAAQPGRGVPNICRAAYRQLEATHFEGDKNEKPLDASNWPKVRDYTSVGLIFRGQLKAVNKAHKCLTDEEADKVFPAYRKKKGDDDEKVAV